MLGDCGILCALLQEHQDQQQQQKWWQQEQQKQQRQDLLGVPKLLALFGCSTQECKGLGFVEL